MPRLYTAIGLMSGTSLDGIDLALLETDGFERVEPKGRDYLPYNETLRQRLRTLLGQAVPSAESNACEEEMTLEQARLVNAFLERNRLSPAQIDIIGFHGQTLTHAPQRRFTWQLGDGNLLARETGIDVVAQFRRNDVAAGGEGAPLLPLYHRARIRSSGFTDPVAVLNIGGVSNVTWIGSGEEDLLAFDTGPGNALIDDFVLRHSGEKYDAGGEIGRRGAVDAGIVERFLSHPYFKRVPPKSLDRNAWEIAGIEALPFADAVATLTAMTVAANVVAANYFPAPVAAVYVTGGGRHNRLIMEGLTAGLGLPVKPVETLGWDGDMLEAEGFAYLAVRSLLGKALSLPTTTGVPAPQTGGILCRKA